MKKWHSYKLSDVVRFNPSERYINPILFFILGIFLMVTLDMFKYESISMFESIIKMIIPFVVILIKRPSLKELYLIVGVLIIGLFINNIYAIYNYMFINSSSRAMGISEGVLYLAGLLLLQFPFYLCILMDKKIINNKLKYIFGVILLVVLISIYINSSRMTWCLIAFDMLVFILLVVQTWKKKILLFMVILLSLSFIYNYNEHVYHKINDAFDMESTSTKGHYYYARDGLNLFYDNKLLGVGLNNFKESMVKGNYVSIEAENNLKKDLHNKIGDKYVMPHAHNDIIMFLSEMGVLGGAIYIIFNITLVKVLFNDWIKYKNYISLAMLMVTINIICTGKIKEKYLKDAIDEYSKRLSKFCKLNILELPDKKIPDKTNSSIENEIKNIESENVINHLKKDTYVICLDLKGKQFSSEEFAQDMQDISMLHSNITFIIGGSLGMSEKLLNLANTLAVSIFWIKAR